MKGVKRAQYPTKY